jgi:hypothetical protein
VGCVSGVGRQGRTPGGRNERIYENTCRIMMRRFPPGERKLIMRVYIINGRKDFVKRNGSMERREKFFLRSSREALSLPLKHNSLCCNDLISDLSLPLKTNSCYGTWGNEANNSVAYGGKWWHGTHFSLMYIGEWGK